MINDNVELEKRRTFLLTVSTFLISGLTIVGLKKRFLGDSDSSPLDEQKTTQKEYPTIHPLAVPRSLKGSK